MPRQENALWKLDNFSAGIHTKPGQVRGGELYAADIENLDVGENAWLEQRADFVSVGPDIDDVTGVATTPEFIFTLHENGQLRIRSKDNLTDVINVEGVEGDLSGRLSVVSPTSDYAILTSEGRDRGYWIDLRQGRVRRARTLGMDKPPINSFSITKRPTQESIDDRGGVDLVGPRIFTAYAITYIRQTDVFATDSLFVEGDTGSSLLFSGMESLLSDPVGFVFHRMDLDGSTSSIYEGVSIDFTGELPEQATGINIYRANAIIEDRHATEFAAVASRISEEQLDGFVLGEGNTAWEFNGYIWVFESDEDAVDEHIGSTVLQFRKIAHIDREDLDEPFVSGTYVLGGEDGNAVLNPGDTLGANPTFKNYFSNVDLDVGVGAADIDQVSFVDVLNLPPPLSGGFSFSPSLDVTLYADPFPRDGQISPANFFLDEAGDPAVAGTPFLPLQPRSIYQFVWAEGDRPYDNTRLPREVTQIAEYNTRIFGAAGDRLVYSDIFAGVLRPWAFPSNKEVRRIGNRRVDFCAPYRESLLFGGRDGLVRLVGYDEASFTVDEIGARGPVDGYAWCLTQNALAYVGDGGFFLTDSATTEYVSDLVLDGFFDGKEVVQGTCGFLTGNSVLFSVQFKDLETDELESSSFLINDGRWTRWPGVHINQFVELATDRSRYFVADFSHELRELLWAEGPTGRILNWAWESNWIKGTAGSVGNVRKRFREFLISAASPDLMTLKYWVDNDENYTEKMFNTRDDLYFQRIPIERRGERIRFRLEGIGPMTIRGMRIDGII